MRKIPLLLFLTLALASCAVYTVGMGRANINPPAISGQPETRIRVINEMKEAEAQAEEERLLKEAEAERIRLESEVNEYPEDLTELTLPHNYRPKRSAAALETEMNPLKLVFVPLAQDADIDKVISSIRSLDLDFAFVTGETGQLVEFSRKAGYDTVLFEGGMILYKTEVKDIDPHSATFIINDNKCIDIAVVNNFEGIADDKNTYAEFLAGLDESRSGLEEVSITEEISLFALSSSKPATSDWIPFTYYDYRTSYESDESAFFSENGYTDAYRATHYTAETDPGITRVSGDIYERLDFIYLKNAIPVESAAFSVAGMSNKAIYLEMLI